jgi:membrane-associated phospholipid phosphatase
VDLMRGLRPADRLVSAFSLALGAVWLGALGRVNVAVPMIAVNLAAAGVPLLFGRLVRDTDGVAAWIRDLYPLLFVAIVWGEMGLVREYLHAGANDAAIAAADRLLFGRHLHAVWMPAMSQRWFSECMFLVYVVYYPLVLLAPVVLLAGGRRDAARAVTFGLALGYLACYAVYAVFPVDGPAHTMVRYSGALTDGFFFRLSMSVRHAGDSRGTAFPSSHVVGAVSMAVLAIRWLPRPVAVLFVLEAAGVILATVYTQNHFAIDAAAGLVAGLVLQLAVAPQLETTRGERRAAIPVPPLPVFTPTPGSLGRGGSP